MEKHDESKNPRFPDFEVIPQAPIGADEETEDLICPGALVTEDWDK